MSEKRRTNMKPEARRNQLLDCAQALFFSKGFEDTTMADILQMAGVSKGGFYHHFKSKDELLFGVLDRMAAIVFGNMEAIAEDTESSAVERLRSFLHLRSDYLKQHDYPGQVEFFRAMNADQNNFLLTKFKETVMRFSKPALTGIIEQGCRENTMSVTNAGIAAEMIITLSSSFDNALLRAIEARGTPAADEAAVDLQDALDLAFLTIDRVLGLPDGTTDFGWPEAVPATMATRPPV
ncbi:TetR/AcrR family transcriptional regulator [Tropicimonas marinistellae]|uniref:TetR/AcrR family transcriptional regulator n=1 Tax=Tropicimonas marinistellae TaxID=1739787 RepID=UPI000A4321D1|nr:TetR/AcrR family transcriptional regulator [Tropicimonas marinistellae]